VFAVFGTASASAKPRDRDRDGVAGGRESDDHDGLNKPAEDRAGNDPADSDTDNDGVKDGQELAGRIVSIDGNVLTIRLARGKTVEGLVSDSTGVTTRTVKPRYRHLRTTSRATAARPLPCAQARQCGRPKAGSARTGSSSRA
jgi:hypothetical protein